MQVHLREPAVPVTPPSYTCKRGGTAPPHVFTHVEDVLAWLSHSPDPLCNDASNAAIRSVSRARSSPATVTNKFR
jgi:hypothetical protein